MCLETKNIVSISSYLVTGEKLMALKEKETTLVAFCLVFSAQVTIIRLEKVKTTPLFKLWIDRILCYCLEMELPVVLTSHQAFPKELVCCL